MTQRGHNTVMVLHDSSAASPMATTARLAAGGIALTFVMGICLGSTRPSDASQTHRISDRVTQDPKQQLHQILQKPAYQRWKLRLDHRTRDENQPGQSWLATYISNWSQSMRDVIMRAVQWLLNQSRRARLPSWSGNAWDLVPAVRIIAWCLLAIAIGFITMAVYRAWRNAHHGDDPSRVLDRKKIHEAIASGQALAMDGSQWLVEAEKLRQEGHYRTVYRALYLGLLSGLHTSRKIDFRRHRTNWSYVSHFKGPPEHRRMFSSLTSIFDDVWYGAKPPAGDADIHTIRAQVATLIEVGSDDD